MSLDNVYKITLAYDGTAYRGWQVQPNDDTVQGRLEDALGNMAKESVRVTGAGRTDSGVHAEAQVAHFTLTNPIREDGILKGLNALLPPNIRVTNVVRAPGNFHARYSAQEKTYQYRLYCGPIANPYRTRWTLHVPQVLDLHGMKAAAAQFVGEHDFSTFRAAACMAKTSVRVCSASRWIEDVPELVYEVSANGFLHHMVRNMVGTLLEVGRGKMDADKMTTILEARDRNLAGPTAPAVGLHLIRVKY